MTKKEIHDKYLENIFKTGILTELAEKTNVSKQAIAETITRSVKDRAKEVERYRKEILADTKYIKLQPNTDDEKKAVIHAMILDKFVYRDIANITGINITKISKLMKDIDPASPSNLAVKIYKA